MKKQPEGEKDFSTEKAYHISKIGKYSSVHVVSLNETNDFAQENAVMELNLLLGESRKY